MTVMYEHVRKARTTPTNTQGLALCHTVAHQGVPARTPTVHRCLNREGHGWPDNKPRQDRRPQDTDQSQDKRAFKKQVYGGGAGSRNLRSTEGCQTLWAESKLRSPGSSRRSRRETEPITQEKTTQEKTNKETEYIKIPAESIH